MPNEGPRYMLCSLPSIRHLMKLISRINLLQLKLMKWYKVFFSTVIFNIVSSNNERKLSGIVNYRSVFMEIILLNKA